MTVKFYRKVGLKICQYKQYIFPKSRFQARGQKYLSEIFKDGIKKKGASITKVDSYSSYHRRNKFSSYNKIIVIEVLQVLSV